MKKLLLFKGKKGLTLIEIIISLALLALLSLLVVSVFSATLSIVGRQAILKKANNNAGAAIEGHFAELPPDGDISDIHQQQDIFEIDFDGIIISEDGFLIKGTDNDNKSTFFYFSPDS